MQSKQQYGWMDWTVDFVLSSWFELRATNFSINRNVRAALHAIVCACVCLRERERVGSLVCAGERNRYNKWSTTHQLFRIVWCFLLFYIHKYSRSAKHTNHTMMKRFGPCDDARCHGAQWNLLVNKFDVAQCGNSGQACWVERGTIEPSSFTSAQCDQRNEPAWEQPRHAMRLQLPL